MRMDETKFFNQKKEGKDNTFYDEEAQEFLKSVHEYEDFKRLKKLFQKGHIKVSRGNKLIVVAPSKEDDVRTLLKYGFTVSQSEQNDSTSSTPGVESGILDSQNTPREDAEGAIPSTTKVLGNALLFTSRYVAPRKVFIESAHGKIVDPHVWINLSTLFRKHKHDTRTLLMYLSCFSTNRTATLEDDSLTSMLYETIPDSFIEKLQKSVGGYFQGDIEIQRFIKEEFGVHERYQEVEGLSFDVEDAFRAELVTILLEINSIFRKYRAILEEKGDQEKVFTDFATEVDPVLKSAEENFTRMQTRKTIFLHSFKALFQNKVPFTIEDMVSSSFDIVQGGTLTGDEISSMVAIYSHNQKESVAHDSLLENFLKITKDPTTKFAIFKWEGKIQSFVAFTDNIGYTYMSGFNVDPDARGFKIGEMMIDQVIEKEAQENTLTANCDSTLPISAKYLETGWVGTNYWEDKDPKKRGSEWVIDIKRDDTRKHLYWGKSQSKESIITQRTHPENVKVEVAKAQEELPFHLCNNGYVLTRMFKDTSGLYYGVFEEVKADDTNEVTQE